MTKPNDDELLSIRQVADRLKVTDRYVRMLADRGEFSSVHVGRRRLFRRIDIDAYVAAHTEKRANGKTTKPTAKRSKT